AFNLAIVADYDERCTLLFFHDGEGGGGEFAAGNSFGIAGHALVGGEIEGIFAALFQQASQITVADNSEQAVSVDNGGNAKFLARHFVDHVRHSSVGFHARDSIGGMHKSLDASEALAEFAAGMQ